jgi:hypothetical protein
MVVDEMLLLLLVVVVRKFVVYIPLVECSVFLKKKKIFELGHFHHKNSDRWSTIKPFIGNLGFWPGHGHKCR